jgi:hypothetical protein
VPGDTIPAVNENVNLLIVSYKTNVPDLIAKSKRNINHPFEPPLKSALPQITADKNLKLLLQCIYPCNSAKIFHMTPYFGGLQNFFPYHPFSSPARIPASAANTNLESK